MSLILYTPVSTFRPIWEQQIMDQKVTEISFGNGR